MLKIVSILFFFTAIIFAQGNSLSKIDSTSNSNQKVDSTKKKIDIDAVVNSSASDSIIFKVKERKMFLFGSSDIKYKTTELNAANIFIDYNTNELEAFGVDSSDTAKTKIKGLPKLIEGNETYEGSRIKYNFKTQRGFISLAKNKETDKRYEGEKVKKVDKNTYFIENGMFTTCNSDTPHTYFTASQMKVIQKDKIIARWIFMYVGGVPIPIPLPFAVFPNETGRRSGIIVPGFGSTANRGQYFHNFGYFWAMNDYMDLAFTGDYYTKGGYGLRSRFRYAKRYDFSGSFEAGYSNISIGEETDPINLKQRQSDWRLSWYHSQQIDPTSQFSANIQFVSSNFLRNNSIDYNTLLTQQIISGASYSKSWDNSSLSLSYNRTQYLDSGNIDETLPNIGYSHNIFYPFRNKNSFDANKQSWYELIGISYSGQFTNSRTKRNEIKENKLGALHNINFNFTPKVGYFNITPNFSYQEKWYNKRIKKGYKKIETLDSLGRKVLIDTLVTETLNELNFVRTFSTGISASTKIYGIFNPNFVGVESFRHTMMPNISFNYTPDFSSSNWGYYDTYFDKNGKPVKYDKYEGQIYGGASSGRTQSINFSVGNIFEIKLNKVPGDTLKEQKKIQLLNFDISTGYNFAADSLKLQNLNLSYRTQIGEWLNFYGNSSYTFYDYDTKLQRVVNKFLVTKGSGLFRLNNFNFSISTNLSGEKFKSSSSNGNNKIETQTDPVFNKKDYIALYDNSDTPDMSIPWNLNINYNYNLSKYSPSEKSINSNISLDFSTNLTKNWKITFRGNYDFNSHQLSAPQITIYRDLHCWEMNFTWNPIGTYRGFHFELRMKASELKDIKVTKSKGLYSGLR
ncbi:putative LPS assembly protein LptD [Stygiobacter electus]|uniref:LPS assembly protein LptD n=1 Tax=Stygiobacter electus TaxID=3032292 RepID=A0AAE3P130_9BACT|nr:putative LPS assembly protein LptD [Stygiobacter electus]MDF1612447.1 putative LPS assembly protein LptD [Stygiobacter electus]